MIIKKETVVTWTGLVLMFLLGWASNSLVAKLDCSDCLQYKQKNIEMERRFDRIQKGNQKRMEMERWNQNPNRGNGETVGERSKRFNREKSNER